MSWTNTGNNRSSIFETFNSPSFGDEEHGPRPSEHVDSSDEQRTDLNDVDCEVIEEESSTTLWMSCSPGRDSPDEGEEEEEEEEEEEYEDEDDSLPLSCFQTKKSLKQPLKTAKNPKSHKKKPKDQNAPKKPMSAYSLFFRDTQSSIKAQNPQATFGDVSRIVASMWDSLDSNDKEKYNSQADKLKQVYLKELETYEASRKVAGQPSKKKSKPVSDSESEESEKSVKKSQSKPKQTSNTHRENDKSTKKKTQSKIKESSDEDWESPSKTKSKHSSDVDYLASEHSSSSDDTDFQSSKPFVPRCTRTDCNNAAVDDPRWDSEFCSADCVVSHCKDVFNGWVASLRAVKVD